MKKLKEKPVPSWAGSMVSNWRTELALPPEITDEMIYAQLEITHGMDVDDERDHLRLVLTGAGGATT